MAAKFGPDQVVLPAGSSDPTGTRSAGEIFYNTSDGSVKFNNGTSWADIYAPPPPLGSISNPATSANDLINSGQTVNGYYSINLGNSVQSIYCILDGSIEPGYGYMRVWDAGPNSSGNTIYHFYTGESDNAAFFNAGGWDFNISEFAIRTRGTWSQGPNYSANTIARYIGNGGGGLHNNYSTKTFNTIFNSGWVHTGFETDNYKNFGYTNNTVMNQLYLIDDNDTACGRQKDCTGTPNGMLSFGFSSGGNWPDHGNNSYVYDPMVSGLYVR